jgi:hypothetical protein
VDILSFGVTKPAAAAWSTDNEERRKAMLAHLAEGLPLLFWDNIVQGSTISCPTIEKVLTGTSYSDRVLGETKSITVPATTVFLFTGNNIRPRGDLASRSLMARINVQRPDPENRTFRHADPIGWTESNRGKILRALFAILLGNPQFRNQCGGVMKTRFKTWWRLIGAAVEHAAALLAERQAALKSEGLFVSEPAASPTDFGELFLELEDDDDASDVLAGILEIRDRPKHGGAHAAVRNERRRRQMSR